MNHWYYDDSDEEYDLAEQDNTTDELEAIYGNINTMIE